jgi:hypothetical protein
VCGPAFAAESVQDQVRRLEAALGRISQEQQLIFQQFQMVQELRRNDERQTLLLPPQVYAVPLPPRNYDDVRREEEARAQRIQGYQYELDRLYARHRELEEQKRPLLQSLAALAQQRLDEEAGERGTPGQPSPSPAR